MSLWVSCLLLSVIKLLMPFYPSLYFYHNNPMYCLLVSTNQWPLAFNYFPVNKQTSYSWLKQYLAFAWWPNWSRGCNIFAKASINNHETWLFIGEMWTLSVINVFIRLWGFGDDNPDYITLSSASSLSSFVLIKVGGFFERVFYYELECAYYCLLGLCVV